MPQRMAARRLDEPCPAARQPDRSLHNFLAQMMAKLAIDRRKYVAIAGWKDVLPTPADSCRWSFSFQRVGHRHAWLVSPTLFKEFCVQICKMGSQWRN